MASQQLPPEPFSRQLRLLLVEDDPISCRLLQARLAGDFAEILVAEDGVAGLELFLKERPDLVVTDYLMPVMNGISMVEEFRSRNIQVPVILVTASMDTDLLVKAIDLGISSFLHKPVTAKNLARSIALVTGLIEHAHLQRKTVEQELALLHFKEKYHESQQEQAFRKELNILENDLYLRDWQGPQGSQWVAQALYMPHDIMCGDSYSLRRLPDGGLLIYLGDAMGKGLASSLTSMLAVYLFNLKVDALPPGHILHFSTFLEQYTRLIQKRLLDDEIFSFSLFHLDAQSPVLEAATFGMPPILLKDGQGLVASLSCNNPPLSTYQEALRCDCYPLDGIRQLLLYSDGLNEAFLQDDSMYRDHLDSDFAASPCADQLWKKFRAVVETPEDDLTLLFLSRVDLPALREDSRSIPSRLRAVEAACEDLEALLDIWGTPDDALRSGFIMALREATLNAYEHGSLAINEQEKRRLLEGSDYMEWLAQRESALDSTIAIHLCQGESEGHPWLRARVRDPGQGFRPRKPNPGGSEFASLNGRGLRLMEKYSDTLYFNEQGNEVSFIKFLPKESPCS